VCEGERATYVVLNAKELMQRVVVFRPAGINAYRYWGAPWVTAVTPYERRCFCAFSSRKRNEEGAAPRLHLELRVEIRDVMEMV